MFAAVADQCRGILAGRVQGAELDFRFLSHECREGVGELAVEQEGQVRVELFLKLKGAAEAVRPRLRGIDREYHRHRDRCRGQTRRARLAFEPVYL